MCNKMYTLPEIAREVRMVPQTLKTMLKREAWDLIQPHKVGSRHLYDVDQVASILSWLENKHRAKLEFVLAAIDKLNG